MKRVILKVIITLSIIIVSIITVFSPKAYCIAEHVYDGQSTSQSSSGTTSQGSSGSKSYGSGKFSTSDYKQSNPTEVSNGSKFLTKANKLLGWLNLIAVGVSVIVFGIIGIKYMVGSVEERAELKKNMKPYIIGCVLAFGITTILEILSTIAGSFN